MQDLDGLTPLGEGLEAEVYLRPDGTVLKLMRSEELRARVEQEAVALAAVRGIGPYAPAALGVVEHDGRPGLIMERVAGRSLMDVAAAKPWLAGRVAETMAVLHLRIHAHPAPDDLPDLHTELRQRIEAAAGPPAGLPERLAAFALALLDELPRGDRICHNDLHLGNVLGDNVLGDNGTVMAIDWADAWRGDPIADVARTTLLHRAASVPPGPAAPRIVLPLLRRVIVRRYLHRYQQGRAIDAAVLRRWELVRAAARCVESINDGDRAWLLAHLAAAHRRQAAG